MSDLVVQITAIVGAIGGLEALKELIRFIVNRKSEKRMTKAQADSSVQDAKDKEINSYQREISYLKDRVHEANVREDDKTQQIRKLNDIILELSNDKLELTKEIGELKAEHIRKRCDDLPCPFRLPPNVFTPPPSGLSKEEYFKNRVTEDENTD